MAMYLELADADVKVKLRRTVAARQLLLSIITLGI
jgi:hypothetical protein